MGKDSPLTVKQDRYATAIVEGAGSQTAAARLAGYEDVQVGRAGHRAANNGKVIKAIEIRKRARLDNATAIKQLAVEHVQKHLANSDDPQYALVAWREASKEIREQGAITDPLADQYSHERFKSWLQRLIAATLKCGMDRPEKAAAILAKLSNAPQAKPIKD